MTALTENKFDNEMRDGKINSTAILQGASATEIYQGVLLNRDATYGALKSAENTTGERFAGVAVEKKTGSTGTAGKGTIEAKQYISGVFFFKTAAGAGDNDPDAITAADEGKDAYILDNNTVGKFGGDGSTCYVKCGKIIKYYSADKVAIKVNYDAA